MISHNLKINLHGRHIGNLFHSRGERSVFTFTDEYIEDEDRNTLSLGFDDENGELITRHRPFRIKIMPFFSNLLPEGHLRKYLAERASVNQEREFFLLWALGRDLPGAITIESADEEILPTDTTDLTDSNSWLSNENLLRFSLAGIQLKMSAILESDSGLTIPERGIGGAWIVKLPSTNYPGISENEFSMMTLAKLTGIQVPAFQLVDTRSISNLPDGIVHSNEKSFATMRFDRAAKNEAVHIEDFAQIFGLFTHEKYDRASFRNILSVLAAVCSSDDVVEFIRRLTFNMLIGNADMHVKNWSVIYRDKVHPSLSPAYDFVSTIPYISGDTTNVKISRHKEFSRFNSDEIEHLANKCSIPERLAMDTAKETLELFLQNWYKESKNLPISCETRATIEKHMKVVPIYQEFGSAEI